MWHIQCNSCGKSVITSDGSDPHRSLQCDCCTEDHHCGDAANETGEACRPLTISFTGQVGA